MMLRSALRPSSTRRLGRKWGMSPKRAGAAAVLFITVPEVWHRAGLGNDKLLSQWGQGYCGRCVGSHAQVLPHTAGG